MRALLLMAVLGLAFGNLLRTEYHEHSGTGSHHALHGDEVALAEAPASGDADSMHAHPVVAPVVMHLELITASDINPDSISWTLPGDDACPVSPPQRTPHRPPIA